MRRLLPIPTFLACASLLPAREGPAAGDLVEAARARQEAVKTADVTFRLTQVISKGSISRARPPGWRDIPAEDTTHESTGRLVLDGGKVFFENRDFVPVAGQFREVLSLTAFDGSTSRLFFPEGMGRARAATGLVSEVRRFHENRPAHLAPLYLAFRGVMPGYTSLPLAELKPTGATPPIDGSPCREYAPSPGARLRRVVWVEPTRDHVIRRMRVLADEGWFREGRLRSQYDIDYRKEAGVWAPTKWVYQQFAPEGHVLKTMKVELLRLRLNEPQPAGRFDLAFPPGTFVSDQTTGKEYQVEPDGTWREVVPPPGPGSLSFSPRDVWLPGTVGVVLTLLAGCWYLLRRGRRGGTP